MSPSLIIMFEDEVAGCWRGFRPTGIEVPDPDGRDQVLVEVEWWGGELDGDRGLVRLSRENAALLRAL